MLTNAVLIAGPTASGKSALALRLARARGGVVVNADSMQVYAVLDRLTARPMAAEMAQALHFLYGHVHPSRPYSVGQWSRDVEELARSGAFSEAVPVFVGGTGLYFRALLEGLSRMPAVPPEVRVQWRGRLAAEGPAALHAELAARDPSTAARLGPSDGQRIVRALEVLDASGRPISQWQAERGTPLVDAASAELIVIAPDRTELRERIASRFVSMMEEGALDEVRDLVGLGLDPALPAMKAIGVSELAACLRGEIGEAEAAARAITATRQYAKRQSTWFRNQLGPQWRRVSRPDDVE